MINSIIHNIKEALKGITRNKTMTVASIGSVAASLFLLGIIVTIVLNINNMAFLMEKQFDKVQVFLKDDVGKENIYLLSAELKKIEHVDDVKFESKEDALENLKTRWGKDAYLLDGMDNPLQNSFIIQMDNIKNANGIVEKLKHFEQIEDIKYYNDVITTLLRVSNTIRTTGIFIITLLCAISLFIIANTIKLALHSRQREIRIMKYIGATDWFIRWPFIIEGVILGFIGSLISLVVVYGIYERFFIQYNQPALSVFAGYMFPISEMMHTLSLVCIVMGIGIGIIGSVISLRRYLKV